MRVIKVGERNEIVIPDDVREELGVEPGDFVRVEFLPVGDDVDEDVPLSPEDAAELRQAQDDVRAGRVYGPFDTAAAAIAHLRKSPPAQRSE